MTLFDLPVHPIAVHLPLGLAVLMPVLATATALLVRSGRWPRSAWAMVAILQLMLVASGFAAMQTGEAEEDLVGPITGKAAIHEHEEAAEAFVWVAAGVAALAVAGAAAGSGAWRNRLAGVTCLGTVVVAVLAARAGHAGGELVYRLDASRAYVNQHTEE